MRTGRVESLLGEFKQAVEPGAAAGQHEACGNLLVQAGTLQIVANQCEQFLARGSMISVSMRAKISARRAVADAGNFDGAVFPELRVAGAAVMRA